jgi:hypothetical protein
VVTETVPLAAPACAAELSLLLAMTTESADAPTVAMAAPATVSKTSQVRI